MKLNTINNAKASRMVNKKSPLLWFAECPTDSTEDNQQQLFSIFQIMNNITYFKQTALLSVSKYGVNFIFYLFLPSFILFIFY